MSKMNYQFMFLFGAVLFSLSALPGIHKTEKVYSANLSSNCQLGDLKDGEEAICDVVIKGRRASAIFTKSDKDPNKMNMRTEVECRAGCDEGKREVSVRNGLAKNVSSLQQIANSTLAADAAKVEAEEADAKKKEVADKEEEKLKELCYKNADGVKFETQAEILDCRVGKLSGKTDAEKKAYYKAHIREKLMELLTSTKLSDRSAAREIVNKLGVSNGIECRRMSMPQGFQNNLINMGNLQFRATEAVSDRGYIQESACDMLAYSAYSQNLETIKGNFDFAAANHISANDPRVLQTLQFAQAQEGTWGQYFRQRGFELRQPSAGPDGSGLFNNVDRFNSFYSSNYDAIIRAHSALLNPNGTATQNQAVNPNPPQFVNMNDPRFRQQTIAQQQNSARVGQGGTVLPNGAVVPFQQQSVPAQRGAVTPVGTNQIRAQSAPGQMMVPNTVPMSLGR